VISAGLDLRYCDRAYIDRQQQYCDLAAMELPPEMHMQLQRFVHQYLQLYDTLDWPEASVLRDSRAQSYLYEHMFRRLKFALPERYQLRVLKQLVQRLEESIVDPDQDVGAMSLFSRTPCCSDLLNVNFCRTP